MKVCQKMNLFQIKKVILHESFKNLFLSKAHSKNRIHYKKREEIQYPQFIKKY